MFAGGRRLEVHVHGPGPFLPLAVHHSLLRGNLRDHLPVAFPLRHQGAGGPADLIHTHEEEQLLLSEGYRDHWDCQLSSILRNLINEK